MAGTSVTVSAKVDPKLRRRMRAICKRYQISISDVMRMAVAEGMPAVEKRFAPDPEHAQQATG